MSPRSRSASPILATLLLLPALAGCGDEAAQTTQQAAFEQAAGAGERGPLPRSRAEARVALEAARARLAEQSNAVDAAEVDVEQARAELEAAEARLESARAGLDVMQKALEEARAQVRRFAVPDPLIFRAVQKQLLEAGALRGVAIAAEVDQGVVILRGSVPDEETRAAAVALAERVDGVVAVEDRIEIVRAQ